MVGERGVTLSGGQKQRISIARALVKDPGLIILDDCLNAVDARTEQEILTHLSTFLQDKTAIVITHRIFSLLQFDRIIVMDDGRISEQGTHEELLHLGLCQQRLVVNAVTLETESALLQLHAQHGGELLRIELAQATPLGRMRGWQPSRPVVQWSVTL